MSYENAPATRMLATHCACCRRPLLDAKSVEVGIGPVCRKRYLKPEIDVTPEAHKRANQLVHEIALQVSQGQTPEAFAAATELHMLGFAKLGEKLLAGAATIKIAVRGNDHLAVATPYSQPALNGWHQIRGQYWSKPDKVRVVPNTQRAQMWTLLKRYFNGHIGYGPKGPFTVQ